MDAELKLKNKLSLLVQLLDDRCEMYGARNTICYLLDRDFTREELLDMLFDEDDVDYVIMHPDEDYDLR